MFQSWQEGDKIKFFSRRNSHIKVSVKIVGKAHYKTFRQMLKAEGVEKVIPEISNIYEGERRYLKIPKYAEREKQYGVLAFRLKLFRSARS